ncbi:6098_t:CDS:2 [Funneliformis mosseae]|uniref:6098_t:CDS:1 n=1 Tax=Funneliformis mosseae TaxID=27381 RepID=A0A9N8VAQ8_FUNMO|nr:6098_t:CDS:2 [Funneliformis mosseae]
MNPTNLKDSAKQSTTINTNGKFLSQQQHNNESRYECNQRELQNNQVISNNRLDKKSVPAAINNKDHVPRSRNKCLVCCSPKILMIISAIYLIIGFIHMFVRLANYKLCRDYHAKLDSTTPITLSYDPSTISTLNVEGISYFYDYSKDHELLITQANDALATNATIQIHVISTQSSDVQFETSITPTAYNINFVITFISFCCLSIPPRCVVIRVEVILPQKLTNLSPINVNSNIFNVKFLQNTISSIPYPYPINFKTTNSDVDIENLLITSASIQTSSGDIKGSITSVRNEVHIESTSGDIDVSVYANTNVIANMVGGTSPRIGLKSTNGDIDLQLNVSNGIVKPVIDVTATSGDIDANILLASGINDSQITINSTSGDVELNLQHSFEGQYEIKTTSGNIDLNIGNDKDHNGLGRIGSLDSQGFLIVQSTSGDVEVRF